MNEQLAAKFLADILGDCYGVRADRVPDLWERYRRFLQGRYGLSDAESRPAVLALKGLHNKDIAAELGIAVETVNKHLDNVYGKARVNSRAELAARVIEETAGI